MRTDYSCWPALCGHQERERYRVAQAYSGANREQPRSVSKFQPMLTRADRDALKSLPAALDHGLCAVDASAPTFVELFGKPEASSRCGAQNKGAPFRLPHL